VCLILQGTSRGGANIKEIVRRIDLWGLDMVFVVGGNGGNAAADAIQREVEKQGVRCVVAGVPKSIDNDILLVSCRSSGCYRHQLSPRDVDSSSSRAACM
jgi:6-phosphofructokinase